MVSNWVIFICTERPQFTKYAKVLRELLFYSPSTWIWKDKQLQLAWWTSVCCHYETMHAGLQPEQGHMCRPNSRDDDLDISITFWL